MRRRGAIAVEMAVCLVLAIPLGLCFADFAFWACYSAQTNASSTTMSSNGQVSIPNGTDTSQDVAILALGKAILTQTNPSTSVTRSAANNSTAITFTATQSWPNFTGIFPSSATCSATIYKSTVGSWALTSTLSNGKNTITVPSNIGLVVGMGVSGPGLANGTTITNINNTTITLSNYVTATGSVALTFTPQ